MSQIEQVAPSPNVSVTRANNGTIAGNAIVLIARRRPAKWGPLYCAWCKQVIDANTLYVKSQRWLYSKKGNWVKKGSRHRDCWEYEVKT